MNDFNWGACVCVSLKLIVITTLIVIRIRMKIIKKNNDNNDQIVSIDMGDCGGVGGGG